MNQPLANAIGGGGQSIPGAVMDNNYVNPPPQIGGSGQPKKKKKKDRGPVERPPVSVMVKNYFRTFLSQFKALSVKSFFSIANNYSMLVTIFILPVCFVFMLEGLHLLQETPIDLVNFKDEDNRFNDVFPQCKYFDLYYREFYRLQELEPCVNVLFGPADHSIAKGMIAELQKANPDITVNSVNTESELFGEVYDHPGKFDTTIWFFPEADRKYNLWVNDTAAKAYDRFGDYFHYVKVQSAIENAILKSELGSESGLELDLKRIENVDYSDPSVQNSGETERNNKGNTNYDYFDTTGGQSLLFGLILSGISMIQLLVSEKRSGALKILRVMGMKEATYWLSWFANFFFFYLAVAIFYSCCAKYLTTIRVFTHTSLAVHIVTTWAFLCNYSCVSLVFSSFINQPTSLLASQIFLIFIPVFCHTFFFNSDMWGFWGDWTMPADFFTRFYHPDNLPGWQLLLNLFFPSYHYAKVIQNIYDVTGSNTPDGEACQRSARQSHERYNEQFNNETRTYEWGDFFKPVGYSQDFGFPRYGMQPSASFFREPMEWTITTRDPYMVRVPNDTDTHWYSYDEGQERWDDRGEQWWAPSAFQTCLILFLECPLYLAIAWYCAQVYSEGHGKNLPGKFPFTAAYWFGAQDKKYDNDDLIGQVKSHSIKHESVVCHKMSKSYESTTALRELSIEMELGKTFCLLGQNGAGKTTTINCLTGLYPMSHGHAFFNGLDVEEEIDQIQTMMGICPQDHVYFNELTGRQHIRFWATFKGLDKNAFGPEQIVKLLDDVCLAEAADKLVRNYSGGMQRKLCVAMSTVGTPKLVFLDEPTTGLDPVSRRHVWEFINKMKEADGGKVVCLTTHSMEEADCLSDKIGILVAGRLKVMGTSLFLKNKFGTGFRLTINCEEQDSDDICRFVQEKLPGAKVLICAGTNVTIGVPRSLARIMPDFLRSVESKLSPVTECIKEYGISNSTLEEVFISIAGTDKLDMDTRGGAADAPGQSFQGAVCALCCESESSVVTAFTRIGVPFLVDGVVCLACAEGTKGKTQGISPPSAEFEKAVGDAPTTYGKTEDEEGLLGEVDLPNDATAPNDANAPPEETMKDKDGIDYPVVTTANGQKVPILTGRRGNTVPGVVLPDGAIVQMMLVAPDGSSVPAELNAEGFIVPEEEEQETHSRFSMALAQGVFANDGVATGMGSQDREAVKKSMFRQMQAIMKKNFNIQKKQTKSNYCRVACVAYCGCCTWVISFIPVGFGFATTSMIEMTEFTQSELSIMSTMKAKSAQIHNAARISGVLTEEWEAAGGDGTYIDNHDEMLIASVFGRTAQRDDNGGGGAWRRSLEEYYPEVKRELQSTGGSGNGGSGGGGSGGGGFGGGGGLGNNANVTIVPPTKAELFAMQTITERATLSPRTRMGLTLQRTADLRTPFNMAQGGYDLDEKPTRQDRFVWGQVGEEHIAGLWGKSEIASKQEFIDLYLGGATHEVSNENGTANIGHLHGYRLNFCPDQNHRFMHVDPTDDLQLDSQMMYKNALLETYTEDESTMYLHGPVPLDQADRITSMDQSGGLSSDGGSFAFEYHHLCGLQTHACPQQDFAHFNNFTVEEFDNLDEGGKQYYRRYVPKCVNASSETEPMHIPQLGNLRANRKNWAPFFEQLGGAVDYREASAMSEELMFDDRLCSDEAMGAGYCKDHAEKYASVSVWWDRANADAELDSSWLGVPKSVDSRGFSYWNNQARHLSMRLEVNEVSGSDVSDQLRDAQYTKLDRSEGEEVHMCLRTSDPAMDHSKVDFDNRFRSSRARRQRSQVSRQIRTEAYDEYRRMYLGRWHPSLQVQPPFDKMYNDTVTFINSTGVDPDDRNLPLRKEFPDVSLSVNKTDRSVGKFEGVAHIAVRDVGHTLATIRRTCPKCSDRYMRWYYDRIDWRPSLYDYVHMMTVHRDDTVSKSGDCRLDFVTATSYMQMHTLVSSLANGARINKKDCDGQDDVSACVNSNVMRSDVLSHPNWRFRHHIDNPSFFINIMIMIVVVVALIWFPVMTGSLAYEKRYGLVEMLKIQSMELSIYWIANYLWFYGLYAGLMIVYWAFFKSVNTETFDFKTIFLVCGLWGHSMLGMALMLSSIFYKNDSLTGISYFFMIFTWSAGVVLVGVVTPPWPWPLVAFPPTNFIRSLWMALKYSYEPARNEQAEYDDFTFSAWDNMSTSESTELMQLLSVQFVVGTLLVVVGIMKHMNMFSALFEKCKSKKSSAGGEEWSLEKEDNDVTAERARIENLDVYQSGANNVDEIKLMKVKKLFPDGNLAVGGVSFGVPSGQCFGLLGPNGAGKTTTINMMCGIHPMSEGGMELCGVDVARDIKKTHQFMGVCPQFDCVWDELSVHDHLDMYAKIKGVPGKRRAIIIRNVAEMVNLDGDPFKKLASELSGGMRRRLSIAISLVTNPAVLVLDEPTTGLDPDTRTGLWNCISKASKSRAVILTTHSMEEADALCERIGIMCKGLLKCIGTPLHLKNKFGTGYMLTVSFSFVHFRKQRLKLGIYHESPVELSNAGAIKVFEFLRKHVSDEANCDIEMLPPMSISTQRQFKLTKRNEREIVIGGPSMPSDGGGINLSAVFEKMEEQRVKKDLPIQEWSVAKTTLDEVFLKIVTDSETYSFTKKVEQLEIPSAPPL